MTPRSIPERLLATFRAELEEQVSSMNAELLKLEQAPTETNRLKTLFRIAHTLKGASRAVQVRRVERVCHALEELLHRLLDNDVETGPEQLGLLYAVADLLGAADVLDREANTELDRRVDALIDALRTGSRGLPPSRQHAPAKRALSGPVAKTPTPAPSVGAAEVPPASAGAESQEAKPGPEPDRQMRVNAQRLDKLMAAINRLEAARGDIAAHSVDLDRANGLAVRAAARWTQLARQLQRLGSLHGSDASSLDVESFADDLRALTDLLDRAREGLARSARSVANAAGDVTDSTRRLRLRPLAEAIEGLPRAVRDIAAAAGKDVRFEISGGDVEADRAALDGLREPLLQLVRNAVDHGVEAPAERERAGKPRTARISIAAAMLGDRLSVAVSDDGAGLDVAAIRAQLVRRGRAVPEDDVELARVIFEEGLSTREQVTDISGRGIGLEVVRHAVSQLRGSVSVTWQAGAGTTFTITCPPTLTIFRAIVFSLNDRFLAVPTSSVDRLLRARAADLRVAEGRPMLTTLDEPVPLVSLSQLLPPLEQQPREPRPVVVLAHGSRRVGLAVDDLVSEDEIVLRPLEPLFGSVPHVSGAAMLGPGRIALVLNPASLISAAAEIGPDPAHIPAANVEESPRTILVVDDSITTRTLEQSILASAGYQVLTAVNGAEGWTLLRERGADLVVADIEMPRMDGFELCEAIRRSDRFARLPVVLVTALDSPEHRARGLEAGADAYIIKSGFDQQNLLDTIRQLLR